MHRHLIRLSTVVSLADRVGADRRARDGDPSRCTPAPGATTAVSRPVKNLKLPVGGISVDDSGNIFAAILVSRTASSRNGKHQTELVRIATGSDTPTTVATGHFSSPARWRSASSERDRGLPGTADGHRTRTTESGSRRAVTAGGKRTHARS